MTVRIQHLIWSAKNTSWASFCKYPWGKDTERHSEGCLAQLAGRVCVGGTVSCKCPGSATLCSMPRAHFFSNLTCEGEGGEYTFSPRCYCVYTQLENRRVVPAALSTEWLGRRPAFKFKHQGLASHSTSNKDNELYSPEGVYWSWKSVFSTRNSKP